MWVMWERGVLDDALLAAHRAAPPAHVVGGLLDLLFPGDAEQPVHALRCEHAGNRLHERRFVGDVPFPPPSGRRQGRQWCRRMAQPFFQPRALLGGMQRGAHDQHPFAPFPVADRCTTGPLTFLGLGRQHLVPSVIRAPYPG